jgi:hypothetical protein
MPEGFTADQNRRFAENNRKDKILTKEANRRLKVLNDYLNSNRVKKLKKWVQDADDAVNMNIAAWNDIVMEEYRNRPIERDSGYSNTYTSVDGELRLNWKEDPKSW